MSKQKQQSKIAAANEARLTSQRAAHGLIDLESGQLTTAKPEVAETSHKRAVPTTEAEKLQRQTSSSMPSPEESIPANEAPEADVACKSPSHNSKPAATANPVAQQQVVPSGTASVQGNGPSDGQTTTTQPPSLKGKHIFVNPSDSFCYWWSAVVSLAFLYNFWSLSYRFAFQEINFQSWHIWMSFDYLADAVYAVDIWVNLRTGYLEDGVLQRERKKISAYYRESTVFYLDSFCLLPFDILYLSFGFKSIFRFNRLVKIYKFWSFVDRTERHTNYPNVFRTVTLVHYILVIFHWNACLFHMISRSEIIDMERLYMMKDNNHCTDISCKYLQAFYWSVLALTIIGDLPRPETKGEYIFVISEYFLGLILFASVLGHVANIVTNVSAARKEFQARLDAVKTFMRTRRVSDELQSKVIKWFDYLWMSQKSSDEDRSVACLPDRLKAEIAIHVNLDTLKRVDIFQATEAGFLRQLVLRLKPVLFSPGDYVCRKDEAGHEMYIVSKGVLEVVTNDGKTVVATFQAGSYFGEIAVLNVGSTGNKRTASVRSVGYSDLFCLSKQDLWDVLKDYPNAEARIRAVAEERLSALGGGGAGGGAGRNGLLHKRNSGANSSIKQTARLAARGRWSCAACELANGCADGNKWTGSSKSAVSRHASTLTAPPSIRRHFRPAPFSALTRTASSHHHCSAAYLESEDQEADLGSACGKSHFWDPQSLQGMALLRLPTDDEAIWRRRSRQMLRAAAASGGRPRASADAMCSSSKAASGRYSARSSILSSRSKLAGAANRLAVIPHPSGGFRALGQSRSLTDWRKQTTPESDCAGNGAGDGAEDETSLSVVVGERNELAFASDRGRLGAPIQRQNSQLALGQSIDIVEQAPTPQPSEAPLLNQASVGGSASPWASVDSSSQSGAGTTTNNTNNAGPSRPVAPSLAVSVGGHRQHACIFQRGERRHRSRHRTRRRYCGYECNLSQAAHIGTLADEEAHFSGLEFGLPEPDEFASDDYEELEFDCNEQRHGLQNGRYDYEDEVGAEIYDHYDLQARCHQQHHRQRLGDVLAGTLPALGHRRDCRQYGTATSAPNCESGQQVFVPADQVEESLALSSSSAATLTSGQREAAQLVTPPYGGESVARGHFEQAAQTEVPDAATTDSNRRLGSGNEQNWLQNTNVCEQLATASDSMSQTSQIEPQQLDTSGTWAGDDRLAPTGSANDNNNNPSSVGFSREPQSPSSVQGAPEELRRTN